MTTPEDFLDLASTLTPEEEVVRATVARFVDERVLPIVPAAFEAGRFPRELVPEKSKKNEQKPTIQNKETPAKPQMALAFGPSPTAGTNYLNPQY
jgi:hypothetical protein